MSVSLILLGWALIEQFSPRPWNVAKITIVFVGYSTALYIGSLAVNYSWWEVRWPVLYYDSVRIFMGISVIGLPFVARNAWWSFQGWRDRRRCKERSS